MILLLFTITMESVTMDKKGHLPTILLVPIAVVLSLTAWVAILYFDADFSDDAVEIVVMTRNLDIYQTYLDSLFIRSIEKTIQDGIEEEEIINNYKAYFFDNFKENVRNSDLHISGTEEFFARVENTDFTIEEEIIADTSEILYTIKMENIQISTRFDKSRIAGTFGLEAKFTRERVLEETSQDL